MSRQMDRDETEVADALLRHLSEGDAVPMEDDRSILVADLPHWQRVSVVQATVGDDRYEIEIKVRRK